VTTAISLACLNAIKVRVETADVSLDY